MKNRIDGMTTRQQEVLDFLTEGLTNKQIGAKLGLSYKTIKAHTTGIYAKLGVASRTAAISKVLQAQGNPAPLPDVSQTTKGVPDALDIFEVIAVLGKAPRDRFGRLELYDSPYRDAGERLREFACTLEVQGSRDTWDQLANVATAMLERLR